MTTPNRPRRSGRHMFAGVPAPGDLDTTHALPDLAAELRRELGTRDPEDAGPGDLPPTHGLAAAVPHLPEPPADDEPEPETDPLAPGWHVPERPWPGPALSLSDATHVGVGGWSFPDPEPARAELGGDPTPWASLPRDVEDVGSRVTSPVTAWGQDDEPDEPDPHGADMISVVTGDGRAVALFSESDESEPQIETSTEDGRISVTMPCGCEFTMRPCGVT